MPAFCNKLLGTYNKAAELEAVWLWILKNKFPNKTVTKGVAKIAIV